MSPEPRNLGLGEVAELEVRVVEVMKPKNWEPKEKIKVWYGGGFFEVKQLRKDLIDKKLIYLVIDNNSHFVPSYPWNLTDPLEKQVEIETLVKRGLAKADRVGHDSEKKVIQKRAEELLAVLRAGKWSEARAFVILDNATRRRMEIPKGADERLIEGNVSAWFQKLYGTVKPGTVQAVRLDEKDPNFAMVSYRHGDLDGFEMRKVNGVWYYTCASVVGMVSIQPSELEIP